MVELTTDWALKVIELAEKTQKDDGSWQLHTSIGSDGIIYEEEGFDSRPQLAKLAVALQSATMTWLRVDLAAILIVEGLSDEDDE